MLNTVLENAAARVMSNTSPAQYLITAHFISKANTRFSFYPFFIEEIQINKDFLQNWGDEIDMSIKISPKDYALMQDEGQDLLCVLTITYVTKDGIKVFTPRPIQKQYYVIINDSRDIRKAVPDVHLYTEPAMSISVRLMEPAVYDLRRVRVNTILHNSTVKDAIYSITKKLGVERLQLVDPDNSHKYDHIDVPSYQGIDSVYQYLHSKFGIYEKGANSYISDGVLYIYPPFETAPAYDKTLIFYQVDKGKYAGAHIFHRVKDKTVSIVMNSQPQSHDLSIAGSENVGTGFIFNRASRSTDGLVETDGENIGYTPDSAIMVNLNNTRSVVKDTVNIKHIRTTDNPYPTMSEIISHQASIMEVQWMHADPFQIDPGHAVAFYYDRNGKMIKKTGIVDEAVFALKPLPATNTLSMYSAVGALSIRLSRNETESQ